MLQPISTLERHCKKIWSYQVHKWYDDNILSHNLVQEYVDSKNSKEYIVVVNEMQTGC